MPNEEKHAALDAVRLPAYAKLFGGEPVRISRAERADTASESWIPIDILVYGAEWKGEKYEIAVTSGMSDRRMVEKDHPELWARRELIQYLRKCTDDDVERLRGMAWLPHHDQFLLEIDDTVGKLPWKTASQWDNAIFLPPVWDRHRAFQCTVDGDPMSLLWHVPLSDKEREFKRKQGRDTLIERMDAVKLPWIFDRNNRPSLVD
jgi:hypothetical protein